MVATIRRPSDAAAGGDSTRGLVDLSVSVPQAREHDQPLVRGQGGIVVLLARVELDEWCRRPERVARRIERGDVEVGTAGGVGIEVEACAGRRDMGTRLVERRVDLRERLDRTEEFCQALTRRTK